MSKLKHKPYQKLKGKMRECNITCSDLAELLNISETAVIHKINGRSDFYISETDTIIQSLGWNYDIFLN